MGDVTPLDDRERVPPPRNQPIPHEEASDSPHLQIIRSEGNIFGHIPGVTRQQLHYLRKGHIRPEAQLDLHGMRAEIARDAVIRFLSRSISCRYGCVLVIHGKGLHSGKTGPVLRQVVVDCLTSPRVRNAIRAFCPACAQDGGSGAMYICLRK